MSIDVEVFRALPPSVQAEVYAEHLAASEHRSRLRRRPERPVERTAAAVRRHAAEAAVQHEAKIRTDAKTFPRDDPVICAARACVGACDGPEPRASLVHVAPRPPPPLLHARLDLDTFRMQIAEWYRQCRHDAPRAHDVQRLERVLLECVDHALGTADGVLRWWDYILGDDAPASWRDAYGAVAASVHAAVEAQYGVPLAHAP